MGNDRPSAEQPHDEHSRAIATPVLTIASLTESQRTAAAGSVLIDLDHGVQLSFDLQIDRGLIRRRTHDLSRIIDDTLIPMRHDCAHCSLRAEIIDGVSSWAGRGRPIVLALPPTSEPEEFLDGLAAAADESDAFVLAQVLAVVDPGTLETDLFGDDLLDERGLAQHPDDRRSVGEVIAHQVEYADIIGCAAEPSAREATILDHLRRPTAGQAELYLLSGKDLSVARSGDGEPRTGVAADAHGIWTVELRSDRPFSPERFRDELAALGSGPLRGRGHFWLPTRPGQRCVWDGAGGQLSIGPAGSWTGPGQTLLVITGADGDPSAIREAFDRAVLTDAEYVAGPDAWSQVEDGLDPWLGIRGTVRP